MAELQIGYRKSSLVLSVRIPRLSSDVSVLLLNQPTKRKLNEVVTIDNEKTNQTTCHRCLQVARYTHRFLQFVHLSVRRHVQKFALQFVA